LHFQSIGLEGKTVLSFNYSGTRSGAARRSHPDGSLPLDGGSGGLGGDRIDRNPFYLLKKDSSLIPTFIRGRGSWVDGLQL